MRVASTDRLGRILGNAPRLNLGKPLTFGQIVESNVPLLAGVAKSTYPVRRT